MFSMEAKCTSIDDIRSHLDQVRQNPKTRFKFPRELWDSIVQLTKTHSVEELCHLLDIKLSYLKYKVHQSKEQNLEFRELSVAASQVNLETVIIELSSSKGMKAKIQGPVSCLNYLCKFFGG